MFKFNLSHYTAKKFYPKIISDKQKRINLSINISRNSRCPLQRGLHSSFIRVKTT